MKRVFIIHGWEGSPKEPLHVWLSDQLTSKGYKVLTPEMPEADKPKIQAWVDKLKETCPKPDNETYFIGHSIGCQTIMRYLESSKKKIKGCVFIAPWLHLQNLEDEEAEQIAKPWLETPINFDKVKARANRFICIFSDNDPFVPLSDKDIFEKFLGAEIHIEHGKGHSTEEDGVTELPILKDKIK